MPNHKANTEPAIAHAGGLSRREFLGATALACAALSVSSIGMGRKVDTVTGDKDENA